MNEATAITETIARFAQALVDFINMVKEFFAKLSGAAPEAPEA